MDDASNVNISQVLIPVAKPSPRTTNSESHIELPRSPRTPRNVTVPTPLTVNAPGTLRMPNVAHRAMSTPVGLQRSTLASTITIPTNLQRPSPIATPGQSPIATPGQSPIATPKQSPKPSTVKNTIPSAAPKIVIAQPIALHAVAHAVNENIQNNPLSPKTVQPLIPLAQRVPFAERPMSPRDDTEVMIHGIPVNDVASTTLDAGTADTTTVETTTLDTMTLDTSSDAEDVDILDTPIIAAAAVEHVTVPESKPELPMAPVELIDFDDHTIIQPAQTLSPPTQPPQQVASRGRPRAPVMQQPALNTVRSPLPKQVSAPGSPGGLRQPVPKNPPPGILNPSSRAPVQTIVTQPVQTIVTQPGSNLRQPVPRQAQPPAVKQPAPAVKQAAPAVKQPTPAVKQAPPPQPSTNVRQPVPKAVHAAVPPAVITHPTVPPTVITHLTVPPPTITQPAVVTQAAPVTVPPIITQPAPVPQPSRDFSLDDKPMPVAAPMAVLPPPNLPDYTSMSTELQAQHRADFRTKFGILRGAWPNYHIPDFSDSMSLAEIHAQYDIYVRHIHISQEVDQYKVYLVIMWLIIELFCTKIGLNIGGYTVAQMRSMNKYERLLIELGETSYKASGGPAAAQSSWSPEIRILFMALVNAVTFIIIKMLASYIGEGMATTIVDALSSYVSGTPPQPGTMLFGGPSQTPGASTAAPPAGPSALPNIGGAFGGIDIASLIGNLGSTFLRGQNPVSAQAAQPSTAGGFGTPTTPRYVPAYDE